MPASEVTIRRPDGTVDVERALSPRELRAVVKLRDVPEDLRRRVMRRDRGTCRYCGSPLEAAEIEIDHVVPIAKGGPSNLANLVVACRDCNGRKGTNIWRPRPLTAQDEERAN